MTCLQEGHDVGWDEQQAAQLALLEFKKNHIGKTKK